MNSKSINLLNAGLIILSLLLAYKIPFELFLFSYAVLGPLHYLTEINWLNERNYFVRKKKYVIVLMVLAALVALPFVLRLPFLAALRQTFAGSKVAHYSQTVNVYIVFVSLIFSIGLIYFKKWQQVSLFFISAAIFSFLVIKFLPVYAMVVAMFIPTVVHVYLFTLLFMVYGAMNEKSAYAWLGIVLLVLSPFVIILLPLDAEKYLISNHVKSTFMYNNFNRVKNSIAGILQLQETNGKFNLVSVAGIKLQVFLAFAYTYHYLNWFSKTSIIGWGKNIQAKKWVVIIVLWALSVGLYYYDYRTGLLALFFLSLLHVFLEFPLNIISVKGIFAKLFMKKGNL